MYRNVSSSDSMVMLKRFRIHKKCFSYTGDSYRVVFEANVYKWDHYITEIVTRVRVYWSVMSTTLQ